MGYFKIRNVITEAVNGTLITYSMCIYKIKGF